MHDPARLGTHVTSNVLPSEHFGRESIVVVVSHVFPFFMPPSGDDAIMECFPERSGLITPPDFDRTTFLQLGPFLSASSVGFRPELLQLRIQVSYADFELGIWLLVLNKETLSTLTPLRITRVKSKQMFVYVYRVWFSLEFPV